MSKIITQGHTTIHNIRPFTLEDITFAVEAQGKSQWLGASVIPSSAVNESTVRPFALYATPANSDLAEGLPMAQKAEPRAALSGHADSPVMPTTPLLEHPDPPSPHVDMHPLPVEELAEAATRAAADAAARAVTEAMGTLTRERERLLHTAQEEAARCLAQAQEQRSTLSEEAYQQGLQQGEEMARQTVTAQLAPLLSTFQDGVEQLANLRTQVLRQAEDDVIDLAFQLARKIIAHEVLEHHHVLQVTLQRALDQVADQDRLIIHVHPEDLTEATALQQDLLRALGDIKTVSLQADTAIGRGGCLVETNLGTIDARIEAQIEELEQRFRGQHLLDMQARVA